MRESQYTTAIGKLLPDDVYKLKLNLRYTAGVPDSWYSGGAGDLWVEYKYFQRLPRTVDLIGGADPTITKLQQSWLRARYAEGRSVAVIVGSKDGGVIYPDLSWEEVLLIEKFRDRMMSKREIAAWITSNTTNGTMCGKQKDTAL